MTNQKAPLEANDLQSLEDVTREEERLRIVSVMLPKLKSRYRKEMHTSLDFSTPWQLLVATMLSAQSQDVQVNKITHHLFKRYSDVHDFSKLKPKNLYIYTKSLGLYKGKSKNIIAASKAIIKDFGGKVPKSISDLTTLPGVGRKTANVVLHNAYGINEGIAVDTHCITTSNRLLLLNTKDAKKIELELMRTVPKKEWGNITNLLIALGRDVCTARRKYCEDCVLNRICPSSTMKK